MKNYKTKFGVKQVFLLSLRSEAKCKTMLECFSGVAVNLTPARAESVSHNAIINIIFILGEYVIILSNGPTLFCIL